jgi:hypothetical protein
MSGTDWTTTPNHGFYLPIYDMDEGQWGSHLNSNTTALDTLLATTGATTFLPINGGTMNGVLTLFTNPAGAMDAVPKQYADTMLPLAGGTMTGPLTLAADPASALQATTKQYSDKAGASTGWGTAPGGNFNPFPFGTYNNATAFSTQLAPDPDPSTGLHPQAGVLGFRQPSDVATYISRDTVALYAGADSNIETLNTIVVPGADCTYTTTTLVCSPALAASTVTLIQNAIANQTRLGNAVGMLIDVSATGNLTTDNAKYTGPITAVAGDGSSVTVQGWYQQGNTATGQTPPNGTTAYINPHTKMWCLNGIATLRENTIGGNTHVTNQISFCEADVYNYQPAFNPGTSATIPTIGYSANHGGNVGGYAFVAIGNWYSGFYVNSPMQYPFLVGDIGTANPQPWGFVSQVRSTISGGHHPFMYYDSSLASPQARWSVSSNGTTNLGASAYDNGLAIQTNTPGNPPIIQTVGPDTNINLRLVTKGTGNVNATVGGFYITSASQASYGFVSQVPSTLSGGHHPFGYYDSSQSAYRWSVSSNGTTNLGNWAVENGLALNVSAAGTPPIIQSIGVDTNIDLRLLTKGTGNVQATVGGFYITSASLANYGFVSQVPSNVAGGHHPFAYYDTVQSAYRWAVTSNGSMNLGNSATENGIALTVSNAGSPIIMQAVGVDTNITLRLVPKGTGVVQLQNNLTLTAAGPTWTSGAGAPASTQPVGSIYSNTTGAVGATLYVSRGAGTWTAVAGV